MTSPTNQTKRRNRAGLVLLSALSLLGLALVGSDTVAWGHGAVAGGGDRVHTCVRGAAPRTVRVVTPAQECNNSEQGVDLPHNGTFIGVDIGVPVAMNFNPGANNLSAPVIVQCTPDPPPPLPPVHRAIGVTVSTSSAVAVAASHPASPTTWEVSLAALTAGAKTATVAAICMRLFQQS